MVYIQEHLRILSGFYGVLKPLDGVTPYRLEMQAKVKAEDKRDLYAFWGDKLYREVRGDDHVIVNLASKEYSRCVEAYLQPEAGTLPAYLASLPEAGSNRRGHWRRWPEERWYGLWQRRIYRIRKV
mgnify:CR=1 FL=1